MGKIKRAFTMIELIFVIVIIAILSKFGVEFLAQAYNSFIFSSINNNLQARSAAAIESIGSRLQYRIKDSIIAKDNAGNFQALSGSTLGNAATVLEWVGMDIDGLRGDNGPLWSGIIDLADSNSTFLDSPDTNTTAIGNTIATIADNNGTNDTGINNTAMFFIGADSDINQYGWSGAAFANQSNVMHPVSSAANDSFTPTVGSFAGEDVYEYYQLAWTAYAVRLVGTDLILYYDYQPWEGERYNSASASQALLMQNVDTFRFKSVGSVVKIQVCVNSSVVDNYSLCKEKTIY